MSSHYSFSFRSRFAGSGVDRLALVVSAVSIVAIVVAVGVAALVQGISGFGFALVVAPIAAALFGPKSAVTLVTMLGVVIPVGMAWNLRTHLDRALASRLAATSLLGLPIGLVALILLPASALKVLIATGVIASALFLWRRPTFGHPGAVLDVTAGIVAGALATSTGTNGPPLVLALQARQLAPDAFRATYAVISVTTNVVVTIVLLASGQFRTSTIRPALWSLPLLLVCWEVGARVRDRIPAHQFRSMVLGLLVVSALVSLTAVVI